MLEQKYLQQGTSRYQAHRLIASLYGVHPSTVHIQLTPESLEKRQAYDRIRRQNPERQVKNRQYNATYRKKLEVVERNRAYQRVYKQAYREIEDLAKQLSANTTGELIDWLIDTIRQRTGIRMKYQTIEKSLPKATFERLN